MVMGPERGCGSSTSTTLRRPIASSIDIVERSRRDSTERTICLYLGIEVHQDDSGITLRQTAYAKRKSWGTKQRLVSLY
jgi:hypothetical protein